MKYTFGRNRRLSLTKEFQLILKQGTIFKRGSCKIYIQPNRYTYSRLGVIIPKKVVPPSTRRHQFKRIVRESFRLHPHQLIGYDAIVIVRQHPKDRETLWLALDIMWEQINRWRNNH